MLRIALNLIATKRLRYAMTTVAIGLVVFLYVLVTISLDGMILTFVGHIDQTSADLWVLPPSDQPMGSFMDRSVADDLVGIDGVSGVERVLEVPAYLNYDDVDSRIILCGYDIDGFNTPSPMVRGYSSAWPLAPGIVIDRSLTLSNPGLTIGEYVEIAGERFEVIGVTQGHQLYAAYPVVFIPTDVLSFGGDLKEKANYFIMRVDEGVDLQEVKAQIRQQVSGVSVYTKSEYEETMLADFGYAQLVLSALQFFTAAIGALIVGVTVYTSVLERVHEFGILKALGGTNGYLTRLVLLDGILLAVPGYILGAGLAALAVQALPLLLPIRAECDPAVFSAAAGVALAVALIGSLVGVRRALSVDPVAAIRGC